MEKAETMTYMINEIHEQPEVLRRLAEAEHPNVLALRKAMIDRGAEFVTICARGTSDNAGTLGKYLFEVVGKIVTSNVASSIFTLYDTTLDLSKWLMLGISQSGESTDVVDVIKRARGMNALTAGITNVHGSTLAQASDFALFCRAGDEKSVAATKTYTSTLGVLYLLASVFAKDDDIVEGLKGAADAMEAIFEIEGEIEGLVERYRYMDECMVIARGINQATCQEAALKLAETCYVVAKNYSAADFQHGPIATVDDGFPVFLYAPPGKAYQPLLELADILVEKSAELIVISSEDEILSKASIPIKVPVVVDEIFSPLVYIVVGQLFAHYLSITKGYNPDKPRGLRKVTLTM